MKSKISILFILLFSINILFAGSKLGYVDTERIFREYKGISDINKKIDKEIEQWKKQLLDMQREIDNLEKEYTDQEAMLSEEAKIRKKDEINKKKEQMNKFIEDIWGENGKASDINKQMLKPVVEKINEIIKKIAEEENYSFIFDISSANIIYVKPEYDITEMVLDELNKEYYIPVQTLKHYIVYDFIAEDKETRNEQYHIKLASTLYKNLKKDNVLEPVNIRDVNDLLKARGVTNIEDLKVADALNYAMELNADYVILGKIKMSGGRIIINVTLYSVQKRMILKDIEKEANGDIEFSEITSLILTELKKQMEK